MYFTIIKFGVTIFIIYSIISIILYYVLINTANKNQVTLYYFHIKYYATYTIISSNAF